MSTAMATDKPTIRCSRCGTERKSAHTKKGVIRIPQSWKRDGENLPVCKDCWRSAYVLRAVVIPVAEPIDATKDEMWSALWQCWEQSTAAANLLDQALARADVVRTPEMQKLPPLPYIYLYREVPKELSGMDSGNYVCLINTVQRKYRKSRYERIWLRKRGGTNYRYPQPYPLDPGNWEASCGTDGEAFVRARFAGRWWKLRLRGGWQFKRLLAAHKKIATGAAIPVEGSIYPGGDGTRLMFKLVAWMPREASPPRSGEMLVTTGGDSFCVATIGQRDPWRLNADHVRRWIGEHETYRQRMADDLKYEKRWPKEKREQMLRAQDQRCRRQQHRIKDFIGVATKMIAGFAARNNVETVRWDCTDKSYLPSFPWFNFTATLEYKLNELGITLVRECSSAAEKPGEHSHNSESETSQ